MLLLDAYYNKKGMDIKSTLKLGAYNIVGLCLALKLDKMRTDELLASAGMALSPGDRFDVIVTYFIEQGNYDVYEVNACLFKYDEDLIGSF